MAESPFPILAKLFDADGTALTTNAAAFFVSNGAAAAGNGTLAHVTNGIWSYTPSAGEMANDFGVEFYHASAISGGVVVQFHSTLAATNSLTAALATNAQLTNAVAPLATQNSVNAVANSVAALPTAAATANAVCNHTSTNATTNTLLWAITQTKTKVDGLFNRGVINTTGPSTITAADIQIIRGDTYTTNSEPISFSLAGQPDLTNSTVVLTIRDKDTDEVVLVSNGSVTTGGAGITQVVDCITADGDTDDLPVGSHPYDVECVLPTGEVWTVATGLASIVKDQTRAA